MTPLRAMPGKEPSLLLTYGLFLLAFFVLGAPWLTGAVTIPWDAKGHWYPHMLFLARALHAGESILYTHDIFAGSPEIADPQSLIFSPLYFLLALIDKAPSLQAMDSIVFLHMALAGLAILVFFRDRGWHWGGGLIAALVFCYGGSNAWRLQHINQVGSLCLWMITWVLLERGLKRNSILWVALAAVPSGFMIAARDQIGLIAGYHLVFVVAHYVISTGKKPVLPLIAATFVGLAISVGPLVLSILWGEESNRVLIDLEGAGRGSLHPGSLMTLVMGNLYGTGGPVHWGPSSAYWVTGTYLARNMSGLYCGALVFLLLVIGLFRGYLFAPGVRFITGALVVITVFTLGWYTPLFPLFFDHVLFVDQYRRPADGTFLIGGHLALLAGYVAHRFFSGETPPRWVSWLTALVTLGLAGFALALAVTKQALPFAMTNILIGYAMLVLAGLSLWLAAWLVRTGRAGLAVPVLVLPLIFDLALINGPNESTALPPSLYAMINPNEKDETVEALRGLVVQNETRRDRVELQGLGYYEQNMGLARGFEDTLGFNPVRSRVYVEAMGAEDIALPLEDRRFTALLPSYDSPLFDILGVRYLVLGKPADHLPGKVPERMALVKHTDKAYIYENTRALPRVQIVSAVPKAATDDLLHKGWPQGFDPATTAILEPQAQAPATLGAGQARLIRHGNAEIIIQTDMQDEGLLVLNDAYHPWWRASVNGVDTPIHRANVVVMGVRVPKGKAEVRFRFDVIGGALEGSRHLLHTLRTGGRG